MCALLADWLGAWQLTGLLLAGAAFWAVRSIPATERLRHHFILAARLTVTLAAPVLTAAVVGDANDARSSVCSPGAVPGPRAAAAGHRCPDPEGRAVPHASGQPGRLHRRRRGGHDCSGTGPSGILPGPLDGRLPSGHRRRCAAPHVADGWPDADHAAGSRTALAPVHCRGCSAGRCRGGGAHRVRRRVPGTWECHAPAGHRLPCGDGHQSHRASAPALLLVADPCVSNGADAHRVPSDSARSRPTPGGR